MADHDLAECTTDPKAPPGQDAFPIDVAQAADWALVIIAALALFLSARLLSKTGKQADAAKQQVEAANEQIRYAKLATVLDLDKLFEGEYHAGARGDIEEIRDKIDKLVRETSDLSGLPENTQDERYLKKFKEESAKLLLRLRTERDDKYRSLLSLLGFFETLGMVVKRKLVDLEVATDLYGVVISEYYQLTELLIEELRMKYGKGPEYFGNFTQLAQDVQNFRDSQKSEG